MLIEDALREFQPKPRARTQVRSFFLENVKPTCPVSEFHRVETWRYPGRCPRCGNFLEKNGFAYQIWD